MGKGTTDGGSERTDDVVTYWVFEAEGGWRGFCGVGGGGYGGGGGGVLIIEHDAETTLHDGDRRSEDVGV